MGGDEYSYGGFGGGPTIGLMSPLVSATKAGHSGR